MKLNFDKIEWIYFFFPESPFHNSSDPVCHEPIGQLQFNTVRLSSIRYTSQQPRYYSTIVLPLNSFTA